MNFGCPSLILKKLLELDPSSELQTLIIEQIYDSALLVEGLHPDPSSMAARVQQIIEASLANRKGKILNLDLRTLLNQKQTRKNLDFRVCSLNHSATFLCARLCSRRPGQAQATGWLG